MTRDPWQVEMEALLAALRSLESFPLPMDTRAALNAARGHLDQLVKFLEDNLEHRRLAALYRVSRVLGTSLHLDEVLAQVMDAVIELCGGERGFLVLRDLDTGDWQLRAVRNFNQQAVQFKDLGISRTVVDTVIQSAQGIVTNDAQSDPRFSQRDSVVLFSLRSILCAPLLVRGLVIGAIYVDHRAHSGIFTEDDLHLLEAFAAQAAIAIENARLYTRTDQALAQRFAELEILSRIDHELNASLELDHVLEIARRWSVQGSGASQAAVILLGQVSPEEGIWVSSQGQASLLPDDALASLALQTGELQVEASGADLPARVVVPLLHSGRALGVMIIERSGPFSEVELQFLARLAVRAATAIENARLYQAVQQANQAKSKFVSIVNHELRTPMTSIKGYTDLLRQGAAGAVNEQQLNFLTIIRNNVERMTALVSDLSDISRIETGRLVLERAPLSLNTYLEETLHSLQSKLEEKHHFLELDLAPGLPPVDADANRLVQVLTNLLSNAMKYTPDGGKIRISARQQDGFVRVEVSDTGIGISKEDQAHLFTQFFRSEDLQVRSQQGWGLGLNVASRIVHLMGGEMGVSSQLGQGSTFWFTLPAVVT